MSGETILKHCSPTLAGIKTGNLFGFRFKTQEEMTRSIRGLNKCLCSKGVRIIPLKYENGRALIYVYRPELLKKDFVEKRRAQLLTEKGYRGETVSEYLAELRERLKERESFPHEIGLFLGYPTEDVKGFISQGSCGYKLRGAWKVYGDKEKAEKLFIKYKKCTSVYLTQWKKGTPMERLTVVV